MAVLRHFPLLGVGILEIVEGGSLEGLLACFFSVSCLTLDPRVLPGAQEFYYIGLLTGLTEFNVTLHDHDFKQASVRFKVPAQTRDQSVLSQGVSVKRGKGTVKIPKYVFICSQGWYSGSFAEVGVSSQLFLMSAVGPSV